MFLTPLRAKSSSLTELKVMCGFAGYLDMRKEREIDRGLLEKMTDKLVHRGPDSAGYFIDGQRRARLSQVEHHRS